MHENIRHRNKVAKNTLLLYGRSFLSLIIGVYSSRIVLDCLGFVDYGIYSLVGGVVGALSFLTGTLRQTTQRYITVELGKNSTNDKIQKVFSMSINVHLIVALLIIIILETLGVYLLYEHLDVPNERLGTAFWVMQFSIISAALNIISVPYIGLIVAHEDLGLFSYLDLLYSILKLLSAYVIAFISADHLILYSMFIMLASIFMRFLYNSLSKRKYYPQSKYVLIWDSKLFKSMFSFSTWTALSAFTSTIRRQGIGVIYNMFYGIIINPALGIANQVNSSVLGFVMNFGTAFMPRITKDYASGNIQSVFNMMRFNAKLSFFVVLIFAIPLISESQFILSAWLKDVPPYTCTVVALILIQDMMLNLSSGVNTAVRASGKVKMYEITINAVSVIGVILFVISFFFSNIYYVPLIIMVIMQLLTSLVMVYKGHKILGYSFSKYIKSVYLRMFFTSIFLFAISFTIVYIMESSFIRFCIICLFSIVFSPILLFLLGFDVTEKKASISIINQLVEKCKRKKNA